MPTRFRRLLACGSTVVVLSGITTAATPTATAAPALVAPDLSPEVIAAYREAHPDVPLADLYARLRLLPARKQLLRRFIADHADTFGGSWYDFRDGVWHLLSTTPATADTMAAQARAAGISARTRIVDYSGKALYARVERIHAGADPVSAVSRAAGVDIQANRVVVSAARERRTVHDPMVTYKDPVRGRAADLAQACTSRRTCGSPLRSGVVIWEGNESNPSCSLGWVARGSDGSRWMYTAGHCFKTANALWGHGVTTSAGQDQPIGTAGKCWYYWGSLSDPCSNGTGTAADFGRVQITNSYWLNGGFGWAFSGLSTSTSTGADEVDEALTSRLELEGAGSDAVCLNGWHRNYPGTYGDVTMSQTEATHTYGNSGACGVVVATSSPDDGAMPVVGGIEACKGDSGGGWAMEISSTMRVAVGIHSGRAARDDPDPESPPEPGAPQTCTELGYARFTALDTVNAKMDAFSSITIRVITR